MISVIMPLYNESEYVKLAIDSVLNLTYKDFELIIILDCPTDGTDEIVKSYKDSRIRVLENEVNLGAGKSRLRGLGEAHGDYIITVDGDDYYSLDFFECLLEAAERTGAEIVSGGITYIKNDGTYLSHGLKEAEYLGFDKLDSQWKNKVVWSCNKLIARSLYDKVLGNIKRYCEDTTVIVKQLWYANKLVVVDNVGFYHRTDVKGSVCHSLSLCLKLICSGLCLCELIEFFLENDVEYLKHSKLYNTLATIYDELNHLSYNDIYNSGEEFRELHSLLLTYLFKFTTVNNIDFRDILKSDIQ